MRVSSILRSLLQVVGGVTLLFLFLIWFTFHPPSPFGSRLSIRHSHVHLPFWGVRQLYRENYNAAFGQHRDDMTDWSDPPPSWAWNSLERLVEAVEVTIPAAIVPPPLHLLHLLQGPAQIQVLRVLALLGVADALANKVLTLEDLHAIITSKEHQARQTEALRAGASTDPSAPVPSLSSLPISKLERLMTYAMTLGYFNEVGMGGSRLYVNSRLSAVLRKDHPNNLNHLLFHFSNESYQAWYNLLHAVLSPEESGGSDDHFDVELSLTMDASEGEWDPANAPQQAANNAKLRQQLVNKMRDNMTRSSSSVVPSSSSIPTGWSRTFNGESLWQFFAARPELQRSFAKGMAEVDHLGNAAVIQDYDWSMLDVRNTSNDYGVMGEKIASLRTPETSIAIGPVVRRVPVKTIVDVGGALGSFLASLLSANPSIPRGVLLDLPDSIQQAKSLWHPSNPSAAFHTLAKTRQIQLREGNFFDASTLPQPNADDQGATLYVLRQILHDWSDKDALRILHNLRQKVEGYQNVAVVIVELTRSFPASSHFRSWIDGQMLVCCNAKERTPAQWDMLLEVSGWKMTQWRKTRSMFNIIEIQPRTTTTRKQTTETTTNNNHKHGKDEL